MMANVLHRITKEYRTSVMDSEVNSSEWLLNPDVSSVEGLPSYYWVIDNDAVRPPTDEEKIEIDRQQGLGG